MFWHSKEASKDITKLIIERRLRLPVMGVERVWYVKKQESKSFNVGPVGIRYIGYLKVISSDYMNPGMIQSNITNIDCIQFYHATDIQLAGSKSQLLNVLSPGYWHARSNICTTTINLRYRVQTTNYKRKQYEENI